MRIVLVDDEPLNLNRFEKLIKKNGGMEIAGKYSNPFEAFEAIKEKQPDVVFLDIEMPELDGLELAEKIQNLPFKTNIVFVTAYRDYAVEAFELHAIDYLVKPVQQHRLNETLRRLAREPSAEADPIPEIMVGCFQSLHFKQVGNRQKTIDVRWRTAKARELFAFLIHNLHKPVLKDVILELLWPEMEIDKAMTQLYSTIYQIRKTLEMLDLEIAISSKNNCYQLDLDGTKLDVVEWESQLDRLLADQEADVLQLNHTIQLYQGDYLADHDYLWAEGERERLRAKWLELVTKTVEKFIVKEDITAAIALYHRVQKQYAYLDEVYFMLMQLYHQLGERNAVIQQYEKLVHMLDEEFGLEPSALIKNWYVEWKKGLTQEAPSI